MIAHVAGVPVEELLALVPAFGASAGLLLARARPTAARAVGALRRQRALPTGRRSR
jgi:hypothetical protein